MPVETKAPETDQMPVAMSCSSTMEPITPPVVEPFMVRVSLVEVVGQVTPAMSVAIETAPCITSEADATRITWLPEETVAPTKIV